MTENTPTSDLQSDASDPGRGRCRRSARRRIKTSHLVLLAAGGVAAVALLVTGLQAADRLADGPGIARAGVVLAGWGRGWHGRGAGQAMRHVCSDERDERIRAGLDFVESFTSFTPEQQPAWEHLTTAIEDGSTKVGEACTKIGDAAPETAPARLERAELMLTTALDVVHEVRPAFDQFYAVLSDEQKSALDRLATKRRWH